MHQKSNSALPSNKTRNLSIEETSKMLSVSEATVRNWVRLGKLCSNEDGNTFDEKYILDLISNLQSNTSSTLKKRRNKKHLTGRAPYCKYAPNKMNTDVIGEISDMCEESSDTEIRLVVINYALQLILQKTGEMYHTNNLLSEYITGKYNLGVYEALLEDIVSKKAILKRDIQRISKKLDYGLIYCPNEDTLGTLYLSLRDMADRKTSGSYFTPYETVQATIALLAEQTSLIEKSILDPGCGTGNFLINFSEKISDPEYLNGWDYDELSIKICRINIALSFEIKETELLYKNFICVDSLKHRPQDKYDIIIGNPPWGLDFSDYDTTSLKSDFITLKYRGVESYDLFVEKAISDIKGNGILAFVLPEAILNVKSHEPIRKLLIENCSFKFISFIGDPFYKVYCPSIILGIKFDGLGETKGCKIITKDEKFVIKNNRLLCSNTLSLDVSDKHWQCIKSIERENEITDSNKKIAQKSNPNKVYLKDKAKFALGIVTGDNNKYLSEKKLKGFERIVRGSNIKKYNISEANNYLNFKPESFQQVASIELYRAPEKLLYRYICDTLVFTYDDEQKLSLNSCNILIPCIPGLEMKYVLAILNSRVMGFYFNMKYNSVKILRAHIESFPIPDADKSTQKKIIRYVNLLLNAEKSIKSNYCKLEELIMDLYGLTEDERKLINDYYSGKNEFLIASM